jgi:hypothetical protein
MQSVPAHETTHPAQLLPQTVATTSGIHPHTHTGSQHGFGRSQDGLFRRSGHPISLPGRDVSSLCTEVHHGTRCDHSASFCSHQPMNQFVRNPLRDRRSKLAARDCRKWNHRDRGTCRANSGPLFTACRYLLLSFKHLARAEDWNIAAEAKVDKDRVVLAFALVVLLELGPQTACLGAHMESRLE